MTRRVAHGNRARPGARLTGVAHDSPENSPPAEPPLAGFGRVIGRSRYVVLIAVVAVLLVSLTLFLLGTLNAFAVTGKAWNEALAQGEFAPTDLLIEILSVIDVMLRAVVFYIIGVGLYSLFIAPLNLTSALGVDITPEQSPLQQTIASILQPLQLLVEPGTLLLTVHLDGLLPYQVRSCKN